MLSSPKQKPLIPAQQFQPDLILTLSLEIWAHLGKVQILRQSANVRDRNILLKYEKAVLEHIFDVHQQHPIAI